MFVGCMLLASFDGHVGVVSFEGWKRNWAFAHALGKGRRVMKKGLIAVAAVVGLAASAQAGDPVLKFDIQQFDYSASGALSTSFSGTINFSFNAVTTALNSVEGSNSLFGPFSDAGSGGTLTAFSGTLTLVGGSVTGGNFGWANGVGDSVSTSVGAAGAIVSTVGSGFQINGLLTNFTFATAGGDQLFGAVDLDKFYSGLAAGTVVSNAVTGDFTTLRLSGAQSGYADGEFVVSVPMPTAAGLGVLGLGGLATRRRR